MAVHFSRCFWHIPLLDVTGQLLQHQVETFVVRRLGKDVVHTKVARLFHKGRGFLGGTHDDRNTGRFRVVLDGLGGFHAIHAGHQVIHKDYVWPVVALQEIQRFFC